MLLRPEPSPNPQLIPYLVPIKSLVCLQSVCQVSECTNENSSLSTLDTCLWLLLRRMDGSLHCEFVEISIPMQANFGKTPEDCGMIGTVIVDSLGTAFSTHDQ